MAARADTRAFRGVECTVGREQEEGLKNGLPLQQHCHLVSPHTKIRNHARKRIPSCVVLRPPCALGDPHMLFGRRPVLSSPIALSEGARKASLFCYPS